MKDEKQEVEDTPMKRSNQVESYSLVVAYHGAYTGLDKTEAKKEAEAM